MTDRSTRDRRPSSWWLTLLRRRAARTADEHLALDRPVSWASESERTAAIAFFNAAFRAEESGLLQAHVLAGELLETDPELAEVLRLYGDEEGWHRELLTQFLAFLGGEIRPMGRVTGTFYRLYGKAERIETVVLVNLMFETIGSTTYRLALREARHPAVRQMLTILTRDESFHVPLNVHFLREALARVPASRRWLVRIKLQALHDVTFAALLLSSIASRRRAQEFDKIPLSVLSREYAKQLSRLFWDEPDLGLRPPLALLWLLGLSPADLRAEPGPSVISAEAAEAAAQRERVVVQAL